MLAMHVKNNDSMLAKGLEAVIGSFSVRDL